MSSFSGSASKLDQHSNDFPLYGSVFAPRASPFRFRDFVIPVVSLYWPSYVTVNFLVAVDRAYQLRNQLFLRVIATRFTATSKVDGLQS
jgi:hypothetical protein